MDGEIQAKLNESLRGSLQGHPWMLDYFTGATPTGSITVSEQVAGLISLTGGLFDALNLLAVEIDALKGHIQPPTC
jgi:hypothetical protein